MAKFETAYRALMLAEGGYVNRPEDRGGETYMGISRRSFPDWPGWAIVDDAKKKGRTVDTTIKTLYADRMGDQVADFYRKEFWGKVMGEQIFEQVLANELLEQSVNLGTKRAVQNIQRALNALNKGRKLWPDLEVDGVFGVKTLDAIAAARKWGLLDQVRKIMNVLQAAWYIQLVERNEDQEVFMLGWLGRISL